MLSLNPFALLGRIHRLIRHLEQFFAVLPVAGVKGDADAGADGELPVFEPHRLLEGVHEFAQHFENVLLIADAGQQDGEFVAPRRATTSLPRTAPVSRSAMSRSVWSPI